MQPFVAADAGAFNPLIASIPDPLKRYEEQLAFKVGLDEKKADAAYKRAAVTANKTKLDRQQQFQADLTTIMGNPTATNISALMAKYPEFADELKSSWDVKDKAVRDADFMSMSEVWSAIDNGHPELAAKSMRQRYDAEVAAGTADDDDKAILDLLESNDPGKIAQAKGMIGMHISAIGGPEHFGSVSGAIKPGIHEIDGVIYDDQGRPIAQSPYEKIIPGPDGSFYRQPRIGTIPVLGGSTGSSAQPAPSTAPTPTGGGVDPMKLWNDFIAPHEGGYSPKDGNGAPVNFGINQGANPDVDVKGLTKQQAGQLFVDRYFKPSGADKMPPGLAAVHADTYFINPGMADRFLKASGGDPDKYMTLRENWLGSLAKQPKYKRFGKAWTSRNAALRDYSMKAGGDAYYSQPGASAIKVSTKAEYDALPTGTTYEAPDGSVRVKG